MNKKYTHTIGRFILTASMLSMLTGCIVTPRVEMTERIDFNYHAPALAQPMGLTDQMCSA